MKESKFKKGDTIQLSKEQIRIVNIYPPGHRYGAEIGSNLIFYHVHSSDFGSDVWREDILLEIIKEDKGAKIQHFAAAEWRKINQINQITIEI